jgi:ADP-ribose pyrophosphatase
MVTVVTRFDIGDYFITLPDVQGADDARQAAWIRADTYYALTEHLNEVFGGQVFAAHQALLIEALNA